MEEVSKWESLAETLQSSLRDAERCNRALRNELSHQEITVAELKQALEELQQQLDTVTTLGVKGSTGDTGRSLLQEINDSVRVAVYGEATHLPWINASPRQNEFGELAVNSAAAQNNVICLHQASALDKCSSDSCLATVAEQSGASKTDARDQYWSSKWKFLQRPPGAQEPRSHQRSLRDLLAPLRTSAAYGYSVASFHQGIYAHIGGAGCKVWRVLSAPGRIIVIGAMMTVLLLCIMLSTIEVWDGEHLAGK